MECPTIEELRDKRLDAMSDGERAEFDEALAAARLSLEVRRRSAKRDRPRGGPPQAGGSVS